MSKKLFLVFLAGLLLFSGLLSAQEAEKKEAKKEDKYIWVQVNTFKPEKWREIQEVWKKKIIPAIQGTDFPKFSAYKSVVGKGYTIFWVIEAPKIADFFDETGGSILRDALVKKWGEEETKKIMPMLVDYDVGTDNMILMLDPEMSYLKKK